MLNKGDFITLTLNKQGPVARALVGKTHDGSAGIKILKIYSLNKWSRMSKGLDVQILKGDDSKLFAKQQPVAEESEPQIESEEDLYSLESTLDEDLDFMTKDSRHIKPDNLVGVAYNQYRFENNINEETQTEAHTQFHLTWGFQFSDNYWAEGLYGRVLMSDFPAKGAQTLVNNITFRLKYTFKAPLYSYIMPYVGYQLYTVNSPQAGKGNIPEQNAREEDLINELGQDQPVFGVTLLRRLVPGWFLKADIGNDIMGVGFAIEF